MTIQQSWSIPIKNRNKAKNWCLSSWDFCFFIYYFILPTSGGVLSQEQSATFSSFDKKEGKSVYQVANICWSFFLYWHLLLLSDLSKLYFSTFIWKLRKRSAMEFKSFYQNKFTAVFDDRSLSHLKGTKLKFPSPISKTNAIIWS